MKRTIYVITEDEHNCGTSTTVHSTEAECNAHLRRIIEHRIETFGLEPDADDTAQLDELKRCLDAGDVDGAWEIFQHGLGGEATIKHQDNHYTCEAHEIELPASTPSSTLADFATAVLEIMENEPEWDAELLDRLAEEATTRGLADTNGEDGMFRRTPANENASNVTQTEEANARCCPRCGGKSIRTSVQQWTAVAEDDPNSSTTLDEHQCGNADCAISFWC
jgi:ssDNA-binding Zn-finger/Zn-ribbon topoisomerase 1